MQTVGVKTPWRARAAKVYSEWHQQVLRRYAEKQPEFGAIWLTYYPNIMVEWYPHVLVVSVAVPRSEKPR